MEFDPKISNGIWSFIVAIVSAVVAKTPLGKKIVEKIADILARPIYDFLVRKGYIKIKEIEAKKKDDNLEKATTKEEIKKAIDEIP